MRISGKELREWVTENDLLMKLSNDKQAQLIVDNFYEAGFELGILEGKLIRSYTDETGIHTDFITLDDVIDMAVENYYELHSEEIYQLKEKLASASLGTAQTRYSFVKELQKLAALEKNYASLLQAFEQTQYGRDLQRQKNSKSENMQVGYSVNKRQAVGR